VFRGVPDLVSCKPRTGRPRPCRRRCTW
jgi:hypothetical protein